MTKLGLTAAALLAFAAAASAQDMTTGHLAALDTNGDGAVDKTEFETFTATAFTTMDKDGNGYLTIVEVEGVLTPEQFAKANTNGDSGLSKQEFDAAAAADFTAADLDGDGKLN